MRGFTERDYGVSSFSELIDKLSEAGYVKVTGKGGQATIETKGLEAPEKEVVKPEAVLPLLREILEAHRLEMEYGCTAELIESWIPEKAPDFELKTYGFQEFAELLNYAQDKLVVRIEPNEEEGLLVYLGQEFASKRPLPKTHCPQVHAQAPQTRGSEGVTNRLRLHRRFISR